MRCPPHTVPCVKALIAYRWVSQPFLTQRWPNLSGENPRIILFGATTWFYLRPMRIRQTSHCLSLLFHPLVLASAHRNVCLCTEELFCRPLPTVLGTRSRSWTQCDSGERCVPVLTSHHSSVPQAGRKALGTGQATPPSSATPASPAQGRGKPSRIFSIPVLTWRLFINVAEQQPEPSMSSVLIGLHLLPGSPQVSLCLEGARTAVSLALKMSPVITFFGQESTER